MSGRRKAPQSAGEPAYARPALMKALHVDFWLCEPKELITYMMETDLDPHQRIWAALVYYSLGNQATIRNPERGVHEGGLVACIKDGRPISQRQLAAELEIPRSTVNRILWDFSIQGLIVLKKQMILVRATPKKGSKKGEEKATKLPRVWDTSLFLSQVDLSGFPEQTRQELLDFAASAEAVFAEHRRQYNRWWINAGKAFVSQAAAKRKEGVQLDPATVAAELKAVFQGLGHEIPCPGTPNLIAERQKDGDERAGVVVRRKRRPAARPPEATAPDQDQAHQVSDPAAALETGAEQLREWESIRRGLLHRGFAVDQAKTAEVVAALADSPLWMFWEVFDKKAPRAAGNHMAVLAADDTRRLYESRKEELAATCRICGNRGIDFGTRRIDAPPPGRTLHLSEIPIVLAAGAELCDCAAGRQCREELEMAGYPIPEVAGAAQ